MSETTAASPSRLSSEIQRYEMTLGDYYRILIKRRWIVVVNFVLILIASIIYTNSKIPIYASSSMVRISRGPRAFQMGGGMYMPSTDFSTFENMVNSDEVMQRVVIRLGLLGPDAKIDDLRDKADEIRGSVSASQVGVTDMMAIQVLYTDPVMAAAIANQSAEAFMEVRLLEKTRQARQLRQFIEQQLDIFTEKLVETEEKIRAFRESGRALGIAVGMESQLGQLNHQRELLLKQFTDKHPDVIKVNIQIEEASARLQELPEDEVELARLQRELEINDRAYRMMKDRYQSARLAEAEEVSDVMIMETAVAPSSPISPRKTMNKITGALVGILIGIILAFVIENIDTSIGTIEDVEQIIRLPVIGVVPFYNPDAGEVPWWRFDKSLGDQFAKRSGRELPPNPAFLIMNQDTSSTLAEAYRILRTFIDFMLNPRKGEPGKVILVTSTGPQEGKSLTAANLGISFAQSGKNTLIIDADLRRPAIHRLFGLKREAGLTDVLMNTSSFQDARCTLGDILIGESSQWDHVLKAKLLDRLEVLTTGISTTTPAELLTSDALRDLIDYLRTRYDIIVIDTPPVLPVTDTRGIGKLADAVFFVYRAGKTARRALTRAKEELAMAGIQIRGIILNQATPDVTLTDKYYYQYYGEDHKGKQKGARQRIK